MKKVNSTLGVISVVLFIVGVLMKVSHIKFAGIVLSVAVLGLLAFFIVYMLIGIKPLSTGIGKSVGIAGGITMCLNVATFLFKTMHWPSSGVLLRISMLALFVTSVLLIIDSIVEKEQEKQSIKTLFAFTLATLTIILLFVNHMLLHPH
jgi:hypothetical protein